MVSSLYWNIVTKAISILSDNEVSEINSTTSFEYLGFKTIDLAELILVLEDKLEISADINTYYSQTVGELITYLT